MHICLDHLSDFLPKMIELCERQSDNLLDVSNNDQSNETLKRELKSRHITMIAIGGIIGPGLLVGSGTALAFAGPIGALIAFAVTGIIVFFVMQSLGEISTAIPVSGAFTDFAGRFCDPALSFSLGWIYWYLWITVLANEYNAISIVIMYWTEVVPQWAWIVLWWFLFLGLSLVGVLVYGEIEFWLSLIKILAILMYFILAILIDIGVIGNIHIGTRYWQNPGSFADGINGVAKVFVIAGTLYAGVEMVGVTAGECQNPRRAVPRAIKQVFWRIVIFYLGTVFFIGLLIPYNSPRLLSAQSKTAASPLTISLQEAGIHVAAHVINGLIVLSVVSAGISSIYVTSRTICYLGKTKRAPKFLGITNKHGVPWVAILFCNLCACICFVNQGSGGIGVAYTYLINLSGVSTFIVWAVIILTHIQFRRGLKAQGVSINELPFRAMWYPYGAYFGLGANIFLIFFQGYTSLFPVFDKVSFVVSYILIPVFLILFFGYKFWKKTQWIQASEMDIWSDRRVIDEEEVQADNQTIWSRIKTIII
jgi:amino acid transporter